MRCRYCGGRIAKRLIGWYHLDHTEAIHIARPRRRS